MWANMRTYSWIMAGTLVVTVLPLMLELERENIVIEQENQTIAAYLAEGSSPKEIAEALGCSRARIAEVAAASKASGGAPKAK
jgi:hypothetical protein